MKSRTHLDRVLGEYGMYPRVFDQRCCSLWHRPRGQKLLFHVLTVLGRTGPWVCVSIRAGDSLSDVPRCLFLPCEADKVSWDFASLGTQFAEKVCGIGNIISDSLARLSWRNFYGAALRVTQFLSTFFVADRKVRGRSAFLRIAHDSRVLEMYVCVCH